MSTAARLARLERRQRAAGEASDQEHLRVGAAIVLATYRSDDTVVAALRAQLDCLPPPPMPGGALDATLRYPDACRGHADGDPDDQSPEMLGCRRPIVRHPSAAVATPSVAQDASAHNRNQC